MSDNLNYAQPASGSVVATDEVSGRHFQLFKVDVGPDGAEGRNVLQAMIQAAAAGDTPVIPAVPGLRIRVITLSFRVDGGNTKVGWKSGATLIVPPMSFTNREGLNLNWQPAGFFCQTAPSQALVINLSAANTVAGCLNYILVP